MQFGLSLPASRFSTIGLALTWLALMLAYSPMADKLATRLVAKPPTLDAFRPLQQSRIKLLLGIVVAWILGGLLAEIVFRGSSFNRPNPYCRPDSSRRWQP